MLYEASSSEGERLESESLRRAKTHGRFESLKDAEEADAKNYRMVINDIEDILTKARGDV